MNVLHKKSSKGNYSEPALKYMEINNWHEAEGFTTIKKKNSELAKKLNQKSQFSITREGIKNYVYGFKYKGFGVAIIQTKNNLTVRISKSMPLPIAEKLAQRLNEIILDN